MAMTINPAVSRTTRAWLLHSAIFLGGSFLGVLVSLVLVLATVDALKVGISPEWIQAGAAVLVAWAIGHDLGLPVRLPYRHRQVPEWLRDALPIGAVSGVYGFMLGIGFLTLFTYSTQLAMFATLPFLDSIDQMIAVAATYAVAKTLVLGAGLGVNSVGSVSARFVWTPARHRLLRLVTAATSISVIVMLLLQP